MKWLNKYKYTIMVFIGMLIILLAPYIAPSWIYEILQPMPDGLSKVYNGVRMYYPYRYEEIIPSIRVFGIVMFVYGLSNDMIERIKKWNERF